MSETIATTAADSTQGSLLQGRTLLVARAFWGLVVAITLYLVITGIPLRYEKVRTVAPALRVPEYRDLIAAGVSPKVAASADAISGATLFVVMFVPSVLFFARGSRSRQIIFTSLTMILYGATFSGIASVHRSVGPTFSQSAVGLLATSCFFLQTSAIWIALFWLPEGRFHTRVAAWFTGLLVLFGGVVYLFSDYPRSHDLVNLAGVVVTPLGVWSQTHHYRTVSNPATRQQIKWAFVGIVIAAVGFLVSQSATLTIGDRAGLTARIAMVVAHLVEVVTQMALPVFFAIAILRYRLWRIDLVINRSLVYGTVTTLLLLIFLGGGFVLSQLLGRDRATIAYAISTVAVALLFNSARREAQRFIDRRVYGFRFDLNELSRAQRVTGLDRAGRMSGRTLGKYHVLSVLGSGGMGEVYLGEHLGKTFAIKVLPQTVNGNDFLKWFFRESDTLAAIDHPNIVKFYESGESDGVCYLVLEYIDGRDLADVIRERHRIPFREVGTMIRDIGDALDYLHGHGLVHRDIKPSNIMIRCTTDGASELVLMDFGIVTSAYARTVLTRTGVVGTISYMAPEQIRAASEVDGRADVYALGVTVYEMLTGELPFKGSPAQVLFAHLNEPAPDPRWSVPDIPPLVAEHVMKSLEKSPGNRFQSAGEFVFALTVSTPASARGSMTGLS